MWSSLDYVAGAYSTTSDTEEIRLSGVDLQVKKTPIGESPFVFAAAEDTRRKPMAVLFTEEPVEEEVVIAMDEGDATIQGSATIQAVGDTPEGPAFGGVVRLERHTVDGIGKVETRVDANGGWGIGGLPGGRYRVRAWVPGRATMAHSEVFFIEDDGVVSLDFDLQEVDPEPNLEFVHGGAMYKGLTGTIGVGVTQRVVDADGLILLTPISGATISIQTSAEVSSTTGQSALTDQDGVARFTLRCNRIGNGNIIIRYGLIVESHPLPGCLAIPPPPTLPPTVPKTVQSTATPEAGNKTTTAPSTAGATSSSAKAKSTSAKSSDESE